MKWILAALIFSFSGLYALDYNGAELYSYRTFQYGRFEARMYMAASPGLISSMFLYYNDSYMGSPEPWREVDIEVLGKSPGGFQSNIITGNAAKKVMSEKHHSVTPAANTTYHTYAIEWTPDYVAWYLDGVLVRKTADQQTKDLADGTSQSLRFNLWISSTVSWAGKFNPEALPLHQFINWVRYYEYTEEAGADGSHFKLAWEDEFDTFDTDIWGAGNWGFDGNLVQFSPDNIMVKDGTLILSLTKAGEQGFTGSVPVDDGRVSVRPLPATRPQTGDMAVRWYDLLGRRP